MPSPLKLTVFRRRAEFLAVANTGKKWVAPNLILQIGPVSDVSSVRYGLTATTRIGNAVVRNRARRRMRALATDMMAMHAIAGDYVLIARATTGTCEYEKLQADLTLALKKMKAWRDA
ncbi:MAG TPA: ribonuclease P protein component [Alphaproteobacteria bacterium]|nr:ribonuclease P protein component [Alphaproteobacteria bacterium]